jgi:hypothetical protein
MTKKHRHRHRKSMKGGFLDNISSTLSGWGTSISQGATGLWQKTKGATTSLTGTTTSYPPPSQSSTTPSGIMGGRTMRRRIRGGFKDNVPTTGLATHAASFSGETAQPNNLVGGRTRRHKYRHIKNGKRRH